MLPPPHVLIVNGSLHGGGAEHVIGTLALHLRNLGHRVTLAAVHGGGEVLHEMQRLGFPTVVTGGAGSAAALRRLITEQDVQVVHSHDLRSMIDAGRCRLRLRRVAHVHTFHFGNYPHLPWKHLLMESLAARIPDLLVAVGHAQRSTIESTLKLPHSAFRTIWNGVDFEPRPDWAGVERLPGVPRIGSVSTFSNQKGLPTLLEAVRLLRDRGLQFRLVLVGEGPLRRELEAAAASMSLSDCVEFTGWKADAAASLLPTFDIFVQSSYWEAMSVVILEAMAARLPIVATTVGENASVLSDGASAVLVPPRDASALADGLARVIDDMGLRNRLSATASESYHASFTGRAMAERYAEAYDQVRSPRSRTNAISVPSATEAAFKR